MTAPAPDVAELLGNAWAKVFYPRDVELGRRNWEDMGGSEPSDERSEWEIAHESFAVALAAVTAARDDARRELAEQKRINASNLLVMTEQLELARQTLADAPHDWAGCGLVRAQQRTDFCTCWKAGL